VLGGCFPVIMVPVIIPDILLLPWLTVLVERLAWVIRLVLRGVAGL